MGTLLRIVFAIVLVLATWNPSRWSFVEWALRDRSTFDAVKAFVGVVLLGGWVFCLRTAWVSLGRQLVQSGHLAMGEGQFPTLELTERLGRRVRRVQPHELEPGVAFERGTDARHGERVPVQHDFRHGR